MFQFPLIEALCSECLNACYHKIISVSQGLVKVSSYAYVENVSPVKVTGITYFQSYPYHPCFVLTYYLFLRYLLRLTDILYIYIIIIPI